MKQAISDTAKLSFVGSSVGSRIARPVNARTCKSLARLQKSTFLEKRVCIDGYSRSNSEQLSVLVEDAWNYRGLRRQNITSTASFGTDAPGLKDEFNRLENRADRSRRLALFFDVFEAALVLVFYAGTLILRVRAGTVLHRYSIFALAISAAQFVTNRIRTSTLGLDATQDTALSELEYSIAEKFGLNEQAVCSFIQKSFRTEIDGFKEFFTESEAAKLQKAESRNRAIAEAIAVLDESMSTLRQVVETGNSKAIVEYGNVVSELAKAKRDCRDRERECSSLRVQVQSLEVSIEKSRHAEETAQSELARASERELLLQSELATLKRQAEEVEYLRRRLHEAETRQASLEKTVLDRSREQAEWRLKADNAEQRASSLTNIAGMLRDTLQNFSTNLPGASARFFDTRPRSSDQDSHPAFGTARFSLPKNPPKGTLAASERATDRNELTWVDEALKSSPRSHFENSFPEDGGFGTNHFSQPELSAVTVDPSQSVERDDSSKSPFSFSRGEFDQSSTVVSNAPDSMLSDGLSDANRKEVLDEELQTEEEKAHDAEPAHFAEEGWKTENEVVQTIPGNVDMDSKQYEKGVPILELKHPQPLRTEEALLKDELAQDQEAVSGTEGMLHEAADNVRSTESDDRNVESLLSRAKSHVKNGRLKGIPVAEMQNNFSKATLLLEKALSITDDTSDIMAEYGNTLVTWAKCDLGHSETEARLSKALELLTASNAKKPKNEHCLFNLGLCHCLLASVRSTSECDALYEKACEYFEELVALNNKFRVGVFNCGLAYISRARLAHSSEVEKDAVKNLYNRAHDMFSASLKLLPHDAKSQMYIEECQKQLELK